MDIIKYVQEFNTVSIIVRLVLATLLGGLVGFERASKGHPAGLRTFALVCLGSALATITNIYFCKIGFSTDASRIPGGVVNGIGFLGVGTIIVTSRNHIRGLTTAAGLWVTATLGIALGAGMIWISLFSFVLIMITISLLQRISRYEESNSRMINVYLEVERAKGIKQMLSYINDLGYEISSMEKKHDKILKESDVAILLEVDLKKRCHHSDFLTKLGSLEGIQYLEEIKS